MTQGLCPGHLLFFWSQGFTMSLQTPEGQWFGTATLPSSSPYTLPLFHLFKPLLLRIPLFQINHMECLFPLNSMFLRLSHPGHRFPLFSRFITPLSQVGEPCLWVSAHIVPRESVKSPGRVSGWTLGNSCRVGCLFRSVPFLWHEVVKFLQILPEAHDPNRFPQHCPELISLPGVSCHLA